MQTIWLHDVSSECQGENLVVEQLRNLKVALTEALKQRDWSTVCRIDRLSAQIINSLGPNDSDLLKSILTELIEIKRLYKHSLTLLEKEITSLSNQAY